ncbi:MAG: DinB family protein [Acidobacteriota bacterium]
MSTAARRQPESRAQLNDLQDQLKAAASRAEQLAGGLSGTQLEHRPLRDRWSIAECLKHLTLTSRAYLPIIDCAIEEARLSGLLGGGPFRMDWMGRVLKWVVEPPVRIRVRTKAEFHPPETALSVRALPEFLETQEQLLRALQRVNGIALDRIQVISPFDPRVHYNLFSCFHLLAAHQRRHLWQAEGVRKELPAVG